MRTTAIVALFVAIGLYACEGSEVRRPLNADVRLDAETDVDVSGETDAVDGESDAPDVEVDAVGDETIAFWFVGRSGELGRDVDAVTLVAADEPTAYVASAGFQIDVSVATQGVADGTEVRFYVGDFIVGSSDVLAADGEGSAAFAALTLPESGTVEVRVETVSAKDNTLIATKTVTIEMGRCVIEASLTLDPSGCVALDPNALQPPFQAAIVAVTRVAGACDRTAGVAHIGDTNVTLAQQPFDADGRAALIIPIDPSARFAGVITVDVTATHSDDTSLDATASASARYDHVAPSASWVSPAPDVTLLTAEDDLDGDLGNGLDVIVRIAVDAGLDETTTATLFVDDVAVATSAAIGAGEIDFGVVSLVGAEAALRVELSDGCANVATIERTLAIETTVGVIAIVTPTNNSVFLAADDGDPTTATTYETSFVVRAPDAEVGTLIEILCFDLSAPDAAGVRVGSLVVATKAATYNVPVAVETSIVGQVTGCVASISEPLIEVSESVRVSFAIPAPILSLDAPVADACVNSGVVTLSGTSSGLVGRSVFLSGTNPSPSGGPFDAGELATIAADGTWSGTYTLGDAPAFDGSWSFTVASADVFGNPPSAAVGFVVDRVAPVFSVTAPPQTIDSALVADEDPTLPGYQTTIAVAGNEASATTGEVCASVNGALPVCVLLAPSVGFAATLEPGANLIVITGRDACGNIADALSYTVTLVVPNPIAIISPAAGTLLAAGDRNAATPTTYDLDMLVDADLAPAGSSLWIDCRPAGGTAFSVVGARGIGAVAADGVYQVGVAIDTVALGTSVECRARLDLPVPASSEIVSYILALPAPTLAITAPLAGTCLAVDTVNIGVASSLDSRTVTTTLLGATGAVVATSTGDVAADAWSTSFALEGVADGSYSVAASATDAFGNPAAASVAVVIDRTAPVVALVAPADAIITDADDTVPAVGVQVNVSATYTEARAGGQVCLAVGTAAAVCVPGAASVTFADVTLQPGDNTLTFTATDACGNAASPLIVTRTLVLDAPVVAISSPPADITTAATTIDIAVTVKDADAVPLPGATVTLSNGGVLVAITPTNVGGVYTFAAVPLTVGAANTFVAEASQPTTAKGVSTPRIVTQKNVAPTIAITSPANATVFVVASSACLAGQASCTTTVAATTTNAEDGSAATLAVSCGGAAATTYQATVTANAATFSAVVLNDQQSCTLTPGITDAVQQMANGAAVTVSVDRTAPTVLITAPGVDLTAANDADANVAGVQAALTATIGGVAAGATVSAVITWNNGTPQSKTLTHVVTTTTADGGAYVASFEDAATPGLVTWAEGLVNVAITVADVNGNTTTANGSLTVDTDASVRITGPATVPADACGGGCAAGTTCNDGSCWIGWGVGASRQLVTFIAGLDTTSDNLRVCTDDPSLAATSAPLCASAASVTGPYREVRRVSATNGIAIVDVSSVLPENHQRLVAEVRPINGDVWVSSLVASAPGERVRRVDVDLQTPTVSSVTSPSDTQLPTGTLNAAEQAAVPRAYDIAFSVSEAGRADVYVNGSIVQTVQVSAGSTTVRVVLPEGTPQVWVVIRDAVGNASPATPGLGATTYQPTVDVTPPSLSFTRPNAATLRSGDNLDVVLSSNAEGRTLTLFDNGGQVGTGLITSGSVTFSATDIPRILSDGSHTLTASIADVAGNVTNAATTPATVLVDTIPPSGTITSPLSGATILADADDVAPGFQIGVTFSTSAGASSWSLSSARCTALFASCQSSVVRASGAVTNPNGEEPEKLITIALDGNLDNQRITLTTTDAAGNTHTTQADVIITVLCAISFQDLPASGWYNATSCDAPGSCNSAEVTITVQVFGLCSSYDRIVLSDGVNEYETTPDSPTFLVTVVDGAALAFEAVAKNGGGDVVSTGVAPIDVDLQLPDVQFIASTIDGFATPAAGAMIAWGVADDLDPNLAGMQFNAAVRVTDTNADGAITSITATSTGGTAALVPTNGTIPLTLTGASPITQALLSMTLADGVQHLVTVSAVDAAGNAGTSTFTATVDLSVPSIVTITEVAIDRRRPRFTVSWTAIANSGVLPVRYEIRYRPTGSPIATEADWNNACAGDLVYGSDPVPAPAAAGATMSAAIGGPDTRSSADPCRLDVRFDDGSPASEVAVTIAVRAQDTNGAWSPLSASGVYAVTNDELVNGVSLVRFDNSANVFGTNTNGPLLTRRGAVIGDITGDGIAEWVVFSPNTSGFCVMRGLATQPAITTINSLSGPNHTCLIGGAPFFTNATVTQAGHHVVSLGDVNGDGLGDFGMSARITNGGAGGSSAGEGYLVVYFGVQGQLPTLADPNLRFRGISIGTGGSYGAEYSGFCSPGDFDGASGATSDIAIGEPFINKVHVIAGDPTWTASTRLQISFATPVLPEVSYTTVGNWTVKTATNSWGAGAAPVFGFRCAPAGDILATPAGMGTGAKDDLLVHQSGSNDARIFVFPGREFVSGTEVSVSENAPGAASPDTEDGRSLRLRQELVGLVAGFGTSLQGVDLNNDGVSDVLVGHSLRRAAVGDGKSLYIFDGAKLQALLGQDVRVQVSGSPVDDTWVGVNGFVIKAALNTSIPYAVRAIGDWDGWETSGPGSLGSVDIAFGDQTGTGVFLKLNHLRTLPAIALGQLPVLDGEVVNQYRASASGSIGTWVDGDADLTGDGLPDFITGSNLGDVVIVH